MWARQICVGVNLALLTGALANALWQAFADRYPLDTVLKLSALVAALAMASLLTVRASSRIGRAPLLALTIAVIAGHTIWILACIGSYVAARYEPVDSFSWAPSVLASAPLSAISVLCLGLSWSLSADAPSRAVWIVRGVYLGIGIPMLVSAILMLASELPPGGGSRHAYGIAFAVLLGPTALALLVAVRLLALRSPWSRVGLLLPFAVAALEFLYFLT